MKKNLNLQNSDTAYIIVKKDVKEVHDKMGGLVNIEQWDKDVFIYKMNLQVNG